jgi:serine phosphatase RsbU (regulator of sigma subunit)
MKKSLLILFLFYHFFYSLSQHPIYKIDFYSPREYGKGHEAQNLACVQDRQGVLYFGNGGGILQYDGISWTFIPVKNQSTWIRTLAVGEDNLIYVGAENEFGYLKPDSRGKLDYVSLSDQLPEKRISFLLNMRIWTWNGNVAFQYEEALFIYSNGKITTILPETTFHVSFLIDNELYIRQRDIGIMKLAGNSLKLVKGGDYYKDFRIMSVLPAYDTSKLYFVTYDDGIWIVEKKSLTGSKTDLKENHVFQKYGIFEAVRLNDGNIALNTNSGGILITDERFNLLSEINKESGLKDIGVFCLLQDYQGNIWAGHNKGIVQIYYSSPVTLFGTESGVSGSVRTICRYNGDLYIGTTDGLYIQDRKSGSMAGSFIRVPGFPEETKGLAIAGNSLIIGSNNELAELNGKRKIRIADLEINAVHYSERLKILFVSSKNHFALFRNTGKWQLIKVIPEITEIVTRFEEDVTGDETIVWMGTALQGAVRLKITAGLEYKVNKYDSGDMLIDNDWVFPFKLNNSIVFSQRNGLLSFVDEETIRAQLPDSLRNRPAEFYKGYFDPLNIDNMEEQIRLPFYFICDTKNRIYVNLDGELGYFDKTDSLNFLYQPFCLTDIGKTHFIYYEENGICWIGGDDGLLMYDENYPKDYNIDFKTLITKVTCGTSDSVIHFGYSASGSQYYAENQNMNDISLSYRLNTITFSVAAPFFEGQGRMRFSSRLTGEVQDTSFSAWETSSKVTFRNLREGDYEFSVKAMNAYGKQSQPANFRFRILSPWYREKWAYGAYLLILATLIYSGVRLYTRRLVEQNKRLEKIVEQRTHEINVKNIELEKQKEEIVASINYANKIQNAVLPSADLMRNWLGDYFILYRPKDIVSGDFYWATNYKEYVVFCVADCTGHGVPGAFMSMMCISFLNEIVVKDKVMHTDEILNRIRDLIIEALKQRGVMGEQKDGMDISLCIYNKENSELEFSGANNPLYIIRNKEIMPVPSERQTVCDGYVLYELKSDRMPIAIYDRMDPFERQVVKLMKDDRLYLFSDGICDQFGGPEGKRLKNTAYKNYLLETITTQIKDQGKLIEDRLDKWQSYLNPKTGQPYSQIDDICVLGIKIV